MNDNQSPVSPHPRRRLSLLRLFMAILLITVVMAAGIQKWRQHEDGKSTVSRKPWFAAYADVTAKPSFAFELLGDTATPNVVLAFIVSSSDDACLPTWGNAYTMDKAATDLDLDRRVARLRQKEGNVAVSFGGLLNDELAVKCEDPEKLKNAYTAVIERYSLDTIDLDLEGHGLTDTDAAHRRAIALADIQKERRAAGKSLAVWVTLPVAPQGLTQDGTNGVRDLLAGGVDLAGINVMTMDYGGSRVKGDSMGQASAKALTETHRQLGILYEQAGRSLNSATLWAKLGATPMIGQNDVVDEIFTKADAGELNKFAASHGMIRLSMWSANRDIQCGDNYVDLKVVSDSCSGIKQDKGSFADTLSQGFDGGLTENAAIMTVDDTDAKVVEADDPERSPYQIWEKKGAYLEGTKVVWHHNVYQAKWWTQGAVPDNPVLQSWQTPWQLVGPVLPGETPIPQPHLPDGIYPKWTGDGIYQEGDRVLFDGSPYQAKWWTQGDSPAASSSNADGSPWAPLTRDQVIEIIASLDATPSAKPKKKIVRPSPTPIVTPTPSPAVAP